MVRKPSVLIVDRSEDAREVLTTALERRGVSILSASEPDQGLRLAQAHRPDLIVLDLELEGGGVHTCTPFVAQSQASQTPLVVLGSVRRRGPSPQVGEFVSKPYHYGPLIRKIEQLLEGTAQAESRRAECRR